jgi:hypothetical protein
MISISHQVYFKVADQIRKEFFNHFQNEVQSLQVRLQVSDKVSNQVLAFRTKIVDDLYKYDIS